MRAALWAVTLFLVMSMSVASAQQPANRGGGVVGLQGKALSAAIVMRPQSPDYTYQLHLRPGDAVPEFAFVSLDHDGKTLTPKDLTGKTYLIDFWATWCAPCVAQMSDLHTAYGKFKDKGLVIITVSVDEQASDVVEFRKSKWPMPWFNSHLSGPSAKEVKKAFEVFFVPKLLLVGPDGRIVSTFEERGAGKHVLDTLTKVFGPEQPQR
jgi:thiol-disulfide isomerase/thioredoxin